MFVLREKVEDQFYDKSRDCNKFGLALSLLLGPLSKTVSAAPNDIQSNESPHGKVTVVPRKITVTPQAVTPIAKPSQELCKWVREQASSEYEANSELWYSRFRNEIDAKSVAETFKAYYASFSALELERIKFVYHGTIPLKDIDEKVLNFKKQFEKRECKKGDLRHVKNSPSSDSSSIECINSDEAMYFDEKTETFGHKEVYATEVSEGSPMTHLADAPCKKGEKYRVAIEEGSLLFKSTSYELRECRVRRLEFNDFTTPKSSLSVYLRHRVDSIEDRAGNELMVCANATCYNAPSLFTGQPPNISFEKIMADKKLDRFVNKNDFVKSKLMDAKCVAYESKSTGEGALAQSSLEEVLHKKSFLEQHAIYEEREDVKDLPVADENRLHRSHESKETNLAI